MIRIPQHDNYRTEGREISPLRRAFPSLFFYWRMMGIYLRSSRAAKAGRYGDEEWGMSSLEVLQALEEVGGHFDIEHMDSYRHLKEPCVFIGNHMSNLETFVLPCLIQPVMRVTFVVKESLIRYPVFRHVMRSRDPIVVGRKDPRQDLRAVLEGGQDRLERGISVIVFPQTTRKEIFDPAQFNTIGVKLARRAGVPVIPIAVKTDTWGKGRLLKDFGRIEPSRTAHFSFGPPIAVTGGGREEHDEVIGFIQQKLRQWQVA